MSKFEAMMKSLNAAADHVSIMVHMRQDEVGYFEEIRGRSMFRRDAYGANQVTAELDHYGRLHLQGTPQAVEQFVAEHVLRHRYLSKEAAWSNQCRLFEVTVMNPSIALPWYADSYHVQAWNKEKGRFVCWDDDVIPMTNY